MPLPTGNTSQAPYDNPLRHVRGLASARIDQGVDYSGSGPVFALGPGVVERAEGTGSGWPGGGFIAYRLTAGPDKGQRVYVAEDIRPSVQQGDRVNSQTKIGDMNGGIETGWAAPPPNLGQALAYIKGQSCYSGGDPGCHPTPLGENFNRLMVTLGAPSGTGPGASSHGTGPGSVMTAAEGSSCLIGIHGSVPILPFFHQSFDACFLSKSQARAILGAALLVLPILLLATRRAQVTVNQKGAQLTGAVAGATPAGKTTQAATTATGSRSGTAPPPAPPLRARRQRPSREPARPRTGGRTQQGSPPRTGGRTQQGQEG